MIVLPLAIGNLVGRALCEGRGEAIEAMSTRSSDPPLTPGDMLPPIDMPGPDGLIVYLTHQAVRGHTIILWFAGPQLDKEQAAAFAAYQQRFAEVEAKVYVVVTGAPRPLATEGIQCVFDPDGRVGKGMLTAPTGIAVIDPAWHLHAILDGNDFAGAIERCRMLFERTPPQVVSLQAPVLLIDGVIEPILCRRLIAYWEAGEKILDRLVTYDSSDSSINTIKKRTDVHVNDRKLIAKVVERIQRRVVPDIFKAFNLFANNLEYLRIGCYDAADRGEFRRHRDNTLAATQYRQFAISMNLNTGEYDGGQVRFPEYGRQLYAPPAGGALVFSCSLLHEALLVTRGRRMGMFTFLHDKEHEAIRERVMREQNKPSPQIRPVISALIPPRS